MEDQAVNQNPGSTEDQEQTQQPIEVQPLKDVKPFLHYIFAIDSAKELAKGKDITLDQALKAMEVGEAIRANEIRGKVLKNQETVTEAVTEAFEAFAPFMGSQKKGETTGNPDEQEGNPASTESAPETAVTPLKNRPHRHR